MAFWKEDTLRAIEATEDRQEAYFQRDLPPHTTPRTGRRAPFAAPEGTTGHHREGPEERRGYTPSNYPTHGNRQDAKNLRSMIASRQVGTLPTVPETLLYVGRGCLSQSIRGPQRFHNTSNIIPPSFGITEAARVFEPPETISDNNPIWIDSLPRSQDERQEEDRDPDECQGPPGGNPDDPDDDGSTGRGPPGGPPAGGLPGGGPPGGGPFGNPNPWVPQFPRGPPVPGGGGPPGGGPPGGPQPPQNFQQRPQDPPFLHNDGFKFEKKIKISDVPKWDGDGDTILEWLDKLNHLAYQNQSIYYDLGQIAPLRLTDAAERWFHVLEPQMQNYAQESWGNLKIAISTYFMNQQWFDRMKTRVLRMRYRQKGQESETPSDYFHCKLRMILEVFDLTVSETIMEIMNGAPQYWKVLIDTSRIITITGLQSYIKYHEESLMRNPDTQTQDLERRLKALESRPTNRSTKTAQTYETEVESNFVKKRPIKKTFVGAHAKFSDYQYPKNDKVVSKGQTPKDKGARACRHCGSLNHWDFDHPFDGKCDNIAFFSSFPLNSDVLRSLRSLRQPPSDSAPISTPLPIPLSPSPFPITRVSRYGLFLVFTDLFPVFPRACIILRSLLDSLRWCRPSTPHTPLFPPRFHLRSTAFA